MQLVKNGPFSRPSEPFTSGPSTRNADGELEKQLRQSPQDGTARLGSGLDIISFQLVLLLRRHFFASTSCFCCSLLTTHCSLLGGVLQMLQNARFARHWQREENDENIVIRARIFTVLHLHDRCTGKYFHQRTRALFLSHACEAKRTETICTLFHAAAKTNRDHFATLSSSSLFHAFPFSGFLSFVLLLTIELPRWRKVKKR